MANQTKIKTLAHTIFKERSNPVPACFWPKLMVRSEGVEVTNLLEDWGAPDTGAQPAISFLISATESTGRIKSSKLVTRGPLLVSGEDNPIKANVIRPGLDDDLTIGFSVLGDTLNFSNREASNISVWAGLDTLPSPPSRSTGEATWSPGTTTRTSRG